MMPLNQALIFAPANDAHASAVEWALKENGMDVIYAPSIRLDVNARFSIGADSSGLKMASPWGDGSNVKSAWARVIKPPKIDEVLDSDSKFVHKQWEFFQRNTFALATDLTNGLWINHPVFAHAAENKLLQLKVANEVGLLIPDTIVSNDALSVREFIKKFKKVVFKQFFDYMWRNISDGKLYSSSPVLLRENSDLPEKEIGLCPGIYQTYIDKLFDLRVTVIGDKLFTARLRNKNGAYVDWRPHVYDEALVMEEFSLPVEIEGKLRILMKRLGLVFGCADFVADKDGHLYFLEVNQQGQFLFVEEQVPQMPLLKAMTAMMLQGRSDYSLEVVKNINFADYLRSEEYSRLLSAPLDKSDIYAIEG